jgi:hypothetical protein
LQISLLKSVAQGNNTEGGEGNAGMSVNYFDQIYERLLKEVDSMMQTAK